MKLGLCHVRDKGSDQHSGLSLSDERRSRGDNSLGARNTKGPKYEGGKLLDEPLKEANIVKDLDERDEEDNGRYHADEEPGLLCGVGICEERNTSAGKAEEITSAISDEFEDTVSHTSAQDKETDDVLGQHATNDSAPVDTRSIVARCVEGGDEDGQAKETDGSASACVVCALFADKRPNEHDRNGDGGSSKGAELGGDAVVHHERSVLPNSLDEIRNMATGDVEEDEAERDCQPEQEGYNPVLVFAMQD